MFGWRFWLKVRSFSNCTRKTVYSRHLLRMPHTVQEHLYLFNLSGSMSLMNTRNLYFCVLFTGIICGYRRISDIQKVWHKIISCFFMWFLGNFVTSTAISVWGWGWEASLKILWHWSLQAHDVQVDHVQWQAPKVNVQALTATPRPNTAIEIRVIEMAGMWTLRIRSDSWSHSFRVMTSLLLVSFFMGAQKHL